MGTGNVPPVTGVLQGPLETFKRWEADLVEQLSRRRTGRREGKPPRFEQATIEAAQHDLDYAYNPKWEAEPSLAVHHACDFLRRRGVEVDDWQRELEKRTIQRTIVDPVLRRRR